MLLTNIGVPELSEKVDECISNVENLRNLLSNQANTIEYLQKLRQEEHSGVQYMVCERATLWQE